MPGIVRYFVFIAVLLPPISAGAVEKQPPPVEAQQLDKLDKPLYTPFIERYMLDELKQLRVDMSAQKAELIQQIVDRELESVDRAVTYATDTITYFFYLIAGASSVLVLVGWSSIRDIRERVHSWADEEISSLVSEYEQRLHLLEQQLRQKTQHIEENREEIELSREVQSLWLRAAQETNPSNKIAVYDRILKLRQNDCEALSYKADAVLELHEPQWAVNLCQQALQTDPNNTHALYQLACAHTVMGHYDEAVNYLSKVISHTDTYRDEIINDPSLKALHDFEPFQALFKVDVELSK